MTSTDINLTPKWKQKYDSLKNLVKNLKPEFEEYFRQRFIEVQSEYPELEYIQFLFTNDYFLGVVSEIVKFNQSVSDWDIISDEFELDGTRYFQDIEYLQLRPELSELLGSIFEMSSRMLNDLSFCAETYYKLDQNGIRKAE